MCILSHYTPNFNQSVILIFMMYTNFFWNKTTTTAVFHVLFLLITLRKCMCMYSSSCYIGMVHVCICVQNKPHAITTVNTRGYTTPLLPSLFLSLLNESTVVRTNWCTPLIYKYTCHTFRKKSMQKRKTADECILGSKKPPYKFHWVWDP